MRFQINNIGAIDNADIDIEGITVIAGENNVGKSTVGKSLYAFLNDMDVWKKMYYVVCSVVIERFLDQRSTLLEDWCMNISGAKRRRTSKVAQLLTKYATDEEFRVAIEDYQLSEDVNKNDARSVLDEYFAKYCEEYISLYIKDKRLTDIETLSFVQKWIDKAIEEVNSVQLDEIKLQTQKIKYSYEEIFNKQYRKIGTEQSSVVFIDDEGRKVELSMSDAKTTLSVPIRITSNIFFLESPKVYDYLSDTRYGHVQKEYLQYLMSPNIFKKINRQWNAGSKKYSMTSENDNNILKNITESLVTVMGGKAEFLQKVGLEFKDEKIDIPIHAVNVSTGLKSMALLEYALRIGAIEKGDILILDEPEINLHPHWQIEYAKALVLLQKEFDLKVIITTHSPYFIRAIECFTDINGLMDKLNVYSIKRERDNGKTEVINVSYSEFGITDLYDDLSAPLEELEQILEEKYGY